MSNDNSNSAPTSTSCNQMGCSVHQTEFVSATTLLVPTSHRPVTLHMASGDLAADLSEVRREQTSLDLLSFNKLEFPNSVNNKALDNSSIKLSGESKKE